MFKDLAATFKDSGERRLCQMEAPSGFEPLNKGFADPPLGHLGTAPTRPEGYTGCLRRVCARPPRVVRTGFHNLFDSTGTHQELDIFAQLTLIDDLTLPQAKPTSHDVSLYTKLRRLVFHRSLPAGGHSVGPGENNYTAILAT